MATKMTNGCNKLTDAEIEQYYILANRYRRGSSETEEEKEHVKVSANGHLFLKGRLMDTHIQPHDKEEFSLDESQVPRLLRRRYIVHGYRIPHKAWSFYIASLLWLHNETINVWTHLIPLVYYLHKFATTNDWKNMTPLHYPLLTLQFATIALLLGSATAHLLHSRSKYHHVCWFMVDFITISVFIQGIGVQRYYQELNAQAMLGIKHHLPIQSTYVPALIATAYLHFGTNSYLFVHHTYMNSRIQLRLPSSLLAALFLYIPLLPRYFGADALGHQLDAGLWSHTKAFCWLLLSGIFMGGHVPERFARGTFDLIGYGHQIFHICVVFVADNLLDAANIDLAPMLTRWHEGGATNAASIACWTDMAAAMVTLFLLNGITMHCLSRSAQHKHA